MRRLPTLPIILLVSLCALGTAAAARKHAPAKKRRKAPASHSVVNKPSAAAHLAFPSDATTTPAYRYAQLTRIQCESELNRRHIPFKREKARGVLAPVRLTGPLHGVTFRGEGDAHAQAVSVHEIVDCRLVLALDDCAEILRRHGIVAVRHYSMYRLPAPSWPWGRPAPRHMGAVAIDTGLFTKEDGSVLDVDRHFHGSIGAKTCGPGAAPKPATAEALELRAILCEIVSQRLFHVVLTPNYNPPHKNHFHLELAPGKAWFLLN